MADIFNMLRITSFGRTNFGGSASFKSQRPQGPVEFSPEYFNMCMYVYIYMYMYMYTHVYDIHMYNIYIYITRIPTHSH